MRPAATTAPPPAGALPARPAAAPAAAAPIPKDREIVRQAQVFAGQARDFYAQYGLGPRDGNGDVRIKPTWAGSSYNRVLGNINVDRAKAADPKELRDTTAHEYSHRITDRLAGWPGLNYAGQSGALSEGLADGLAAAIVARADGPAGEKPALRTLDPTGQTMDMGRMYGTRKVPTHMRDYDTLWLYDMGGVHLNAGIIRKGLHEIGSRLGLQAMGDVVMGAAMTDLRRSTRFEGFARSTVRSAGRLFGEADPRTAVVSDAWRGVGLLGGDQQPDEGLMIRAVRADRGSEVPSAKGTHQCCAGSLPR